jgi:flagellar motility protein MotE (MotC chaperone)
MAAAPHSKPRTPVPPPLPAPPARAPQPPTPSRTSRAHRGLLPATLGAMGVLLAVKLGALATATPGPSAAAGGSALVGAAHASEPSPAAPQPPRPAAAPQCTPEPVQPTPEQRAEREVLQALRSRRAELDAREQALLTREVVAVATERRAAQRLDELAALQRQAAAAAAAAERERTQGERAQQERADRERVEREEAGWRQMVKLYEGMRPREAAAIFDDLDLPVLVPLMDRLREAKAAPILGAMRPDRARALTAELARHRSRAPDR